MALIVQKFGGSSVKDRDRIFNVARIVANTRNQGNDVVVVVSAQGDTTDDLIIRVKVIRMIINMAMIIVPMRFRINLTITFSFFRVHGRRTGNGAPTAALWP